MDIYLVLAMARSGHHAIINWIAKQYPGKITHRNNCILGWKNKELLPHKTQNHTFNNKGAKTGVICNIEEFELNDFNKHNFLEFPLIKNAKRFFCLIVIRDARNWLASSISRGGWMVEHLNHPNFKSRIETYKNHLKECLQTSIIPIPIIDINYNNWFSDKEYRKMLAGKLKLEFTDIGIDEIPSFGNGSSFDSSLKRKVLERYKKLENNNTYKHHTSDLELMDLSRKYFG